MSESKYSSISQNKQFNVYEHSQVSDQSQLFSNSKFQQSLDFQNYKSKRRSKKDKSGRDFACGCGKKYLSYPALYTHIKQKHNGIQPKGTHTQNTHERHRGRPPKKHELSQLAPTIATHKSPPPMAHSQCSLSDHPIELEEGAPTPTLAPNNFPPPITDIIPHSYPIDLDITELEAMKLLSQDPKKEDPCDWQLDLFSNTLDYQKKRQREHPWVQIILKIVKDGSGVPAGGTCDQCFSAFLFGVSRIAGEVGYKVFAIILKLMRECINFKLLESLQNAVNEQQIPIDPDFIQKIKTQTIDKIPFCSVNSPYYIPLIANEFIQNYIPIEQPALPQELAMQVLNDYFNWLQKKGFTKIYAKINEGIDKSLKF